MKHSLSLFFLFQLTELCSLSFLNRPSSLQSIPQRSISLISFISLKAPQHLFSKYVIKFQNVSNLYPRRKDIFQMLNGIITCLLKISPHEINLFSSKKNLTLFHKSPFYRLKRQHWSSSNAS